MIDNDQLSFANPFRPQNSPQPSIDQPHEPTLPYTMTTSFKQHYDHQPSIDPWVPTTTGSTPSPRNVVTRRAPGHRVDGDLHREAKGATGQLEKPHRRWSLRWSAGLGDEPPTHMANPNGC